MIVSSISFQNNIIESYNCIHRQLHPIELVTNPTGYIGRYSDRRISNSVDYKVELKCELSNENLSIKEYPDIELYDC